MDSKKVKLDSKNHGSEDVASAKGNTNSPGEGIEVDTIVGNPPTPDQEDVTAECNLETIVLDPVVDKPQLDAVKKHLEMMERPVEMMTEPVNADDEVNPPRVPSTPRSAKFVPDCVGGWETGTNLDTDVFEKQPGIASDTTDSVTTDASTYPTASMVEDVPCTVLVNQCVEKDSLEYNMSHQRRGRAVIFNHVNFVKAKKREGSDVDRDNLVKTLKHLDFDIEDVEICEDFTCDQIKQKIKLLNKEDHSNADCLVIAILTHGQDGDYLEAKDKLYSFGHMWTSFTANRCQRLAGKPKIFFIQACRGDLTDRGVGVVPTSESQIQTDSSPVVYQLPSHADFLLAYSTVDGHYAYRNPEKGSWFIQSLCKELQENDTSKVDLQRILTRTARRVALDFPTDKEKGETSTANGIEEFKPLEEIPNQVPTILSTLIREVYFPPKPKPSGEITQE